MNDVVKVDSVSRAINRLSEFVDKGKVTLEEFAENSLHQLVRLSPSDSALLVKGFKPQEIRALYDHMEKTCVTCGFRPSGSPFVANKNDFAEIAAIEQELEPKYRSLYGEISTLVHKTTGQ